MAPRFYRIMEHTADTGFEVWGPTKEKVFETAGMALFDMMWQLGRLQEIKSEIIKVHGNDLQELLVNFLEEFLYLYDAKQLVCSRLQVETVTTDTVRAKACLQPFDDTSDQELLGVKAVTYHQLFIGRKSGRWLAQVFLDI